MFGKKKAQEGAQLERQAMRVTALAYLTKQLNECEASAEVAALLGGAELAEELALITHEEYLLFHTDAHKRNKAYEQRRKEEQAKKAAERKAERVAAAKAAKGIE